MSIKVLRSAIENETALGVRGHREAVEFLLAFFDQNTGHLTEKQKEYYFQKWKASPYAVGDEKENP